MAEITLFAGLSSADFVEIDIPADYIPLHDWHQRVIEQPSVKATMAG